MEQNWFCNDKIFVLLAGGSRCTVSSHGGSVHIFPGALVNDSDLGVAGSSGERRREDVGEETEEEEGGSSLPKRIKLDLN